MARRRERRPEPRPTAALGEGDVPSLLQLEQFTQASLRQWLAAGRALDELQRSVFFGLERQRKAHSEELVEAIRGKLIPGSPFTGWARITDYRYCLEPLSVAGSLRHGGRFNIGEDIDAAAFPPFPALYIAENYETAYRERFGNEPTQSQPAKLSPDEFALRSPGSFTHVALRGALELVLDASDAAALSPFVAVLRQFVMPREVRVLARQLGMRAPPTLIRSVTNLQRQMLHPHWRALPVQFALPSNSQVFGRIAAAAGAHGILYPSARNATGHCLALFPQNWPGGASFVEVIDPVPSEARFTRVDGKSTTLQ